MGLSNSLPVKAIQIPDIFDLIYFSLCSMVPGLCIPGPMDIMDCNFVPGLILGIAYFMQCSHRSCWSWQHCPTLLFQSFCPDPVLVSQTMAATILYKHTWCEDHGASSSAPAAALAVQDPHVAISPRDEVRAGPSADLSLQTSPLPPQPVLTHFLQRVNNLSQIGISLRTAVISAHASTTAVAALALRAHKAFYELLLSAWLWMALLHTHCSWKHPQYLVPEQRSEGGRDLATPAWPLLLKLTRVLHLPPLGTMVTLQD